MLTVAVELSRALVNSKSGDDFVLICSRERPESLRDLDCEAVLTAHRHELAVKARWMPAIEPLLEADAILYPYWPSPPYRRPGAPPPVISSTTWHSACGRARFRGSSGSTSGLCSR